MAEQDDMDYDFSAPRRHSRNEANERNFEGDPRPFEDAVEDYADEAANDEYLNDDFDEDDFISDDYDDDFGYEDDEFQYLSTPPGAFYRACARTLQHGPRIELDLSADGDDVNGFVPSAKTQDRGPSYML